MNFMLAAPSAQCASPDRVRKELMAVLRGAQERFTDEQLSDASGVDARAIKSYRVEGKEPSLSRALSILCALGRTDLNRILNIIGYAAVSLEEADEIMAAGKIVAACMNSMAPIAQAAADGRFDHTELPVCRKAADDLIAAVLPLSSAGAAE